MSGINYYQLLGIHATATDGEIRRAYLRLSLQYHPDKRRTPDADADELYRSIQEAYETLSCPEKRCLYDFVGSFAALAELTSSHPMAMPAQSYRHQRRSAVVAEFSNGLGSRSSSGETLSSWGISSLASGSRMSPCPSLETNLSCSPSGGLLTRSLGAGSGSAGRFRVGNLARACNEPGAVRAATDAGAGSTGSFSVSNSRDDGADGAGHSSAAATGRRNLGSGSQPASTATPLPYYPTSAAVHVNTRSPPHAPHLQPDRQKEPFEPLGASPPNSAKLIIPPTFAGGDDDGGGCSSPVASPGTMLGKRRSPGADGTQQAHSPSHLHSPPDSFTATPTQVVQPHLYPHPSHLHPQRQPQAQPRQQLQPCDPAVATAAVAANGRGSGSFCATPSGGGRRAHSADVHHRLMLTLEEMYSGCVKQLRLMRRVYQPPAAAEGLSVASSPPSSSSGIAELLLHEVAAADAAAAVGPILPIGPTEEMEGLDGGISGDGGGGSWVPWRCVEELFRVVVQPGWREGTKVTFPGKGDELPCGSRGDMVLVVAQAAHGRYERHGNDLHTVVVVPLVDALTGGDTAITTLDGRTLAFPLGPCCLQPFSHCVVKGEGMPILRGKTGLARGARAASGSVDATAAGVAASPPRGDLHVRFEVSFPADLTTEQKTELRRALLE